ncbi:MAG: leucine-rich repeat protein [Lachnospiraceae bacterium]|nr:leucine-rich repeat protein [Lachnospiraceae bacterium]
MAEQMISKKQFFGQKGLASYVVPKGVTEIGDWAFARCRDLRWVAIPGGLKRIGKGAFAECDSLLEAFFYEGEWNGQGTETSGSKESKQGAGSAGSGERKQGAGSPGQKERMTAGLMAGAFRFFSDVQRLVSGERDPATDEARLAVWDELCVQFLKQPDETGFVPFLAGGEEDYADDGERLAGYCEEVRTVKAKLVYQRLLADRLCAETGLGLEADRKEFYQAYLRGNDRAVTILMGLTAHFREAVELYEAAGLFEQENIGSLIARIPQDKVELRALLVQRQEGNIWDEMRLF